MRRGVSLLCSNSINFKVKRTKSSIILKKLFKAIEDVNQDPMNREICSLTTELNQVKKKAINLRKMPKHHLYT